MSKFATRLLVMLAIYALAWIALIQFPSVAAFDVNVQSWGWAVLAGTMIASSVAYGYVSGFTKGLVGPAVSSNPLARIVAKTFSYLCFAGILIAVAGQFPAWISITSAAGFYWLLGAMGFASSICDEIDARFFPKQDTK